ncbi:hypothetical protein [Maricaulis sp.]|uniref:hypothetical protein n=1 Tax=Maricaulis sp. TaxID=1486257 RepID=UPI0026057B86|nr:hypothetical protein [Maricaulis sp.]
MTLPAALIAFPVAVLVAWSVLAAGILDHPNARSSHARPTPRGGGIGVLAGVFAALLVIPVTGPAEGAALAGTVLCGGMAAGLGLLDDLLTLSERLKFAVLTTLGLALSVMAGPVTGLGIALPWIVGLAGSALWVFTVANAVNFMDGSDGLLTATLIPAALALGLLADGGTADASLALAAGLAGFAVWNAPLLRPRGRLFCGDVGSLGIAVIFAGLALHWAATAPAGSVWLAPLLILPLLGDVLLTMAARVRAGRSPFVAHRAHAYQLLIRMGKSHARIAAIWGGLSLACGALALAGAAGGAWVKFAVFAIGVAAFAIIHRVVRKMAMAAGLDVYQ